MNTVGGYKFVKFLGSGSFGGVWECVHITSGEHVACKIMDLENLRDPDFLPHFKNELMIHSQIRHPGITQLIDVMTDSDNIYVMIELCDGGDLNDLVMEADGLPEERARHYFKEIMGAICFIHSMGIAHRDIKLENILVTQADCAKLTDFGLCKEQGKDNLLLTTCGTLVYAAPEIIKEEPYNGMKADIWSAGVVLYAMVANHFPWSTDESLPAERLVHETARQIMEGEINLPEDISFELGNLLSNMLNVEAEERPSAEDILHHPWMEMDEDEPAPSQSRPPDPNVVSAVKSVLAELEKKSREMCE